MSFLELPADGDDTKIQKVAQNLLQRKEFYQLASDLDRDFRDPNYDELHNKHLKLRSHQLFTRNLINATSPYTRLLIKWKTGTGKTSGAISIARELIDVYSRLFNDRVLQLGSDRVAYSTASKTTPSVFVLGFTKANIVKELMKYPEFGFISADEKDELRKLSTLTETNDEYAKKYKELLAAVRHRIVNKSYGGFYKFFGYQEFVNRLFMSDTINLVELENTAMKNPLGPSLEDIIHEHIREGKIQINSELLEQFENSLIICDEIHNTYNSVMKNNYGIAIQYVLDTVASVRAIFLSATPINNSPSEIIDVMNYLLPANQKIYKKDFFKPELTDEKLELLGKLSFGRVSFVQDMNPRYYPETFNAGTVRKLRHAIGETTTIPYLKFIECPMSEIHLATYKQFLIDTKQTMHDIEIQQDDDSMTTDEISDESAITEPIDEFATTNTTTTKVTMAADSYTLTDMAFPNPHSDKIGLFKSSNVIASYRDAPKHWLQEHGVTLSKKANSSYVVSGDWLLPNRIVKYSTKLSTLGKIIDGAFIKSLKALQQNEDPREVGEKMLIYHDRVKMSGIQLIEEFMMKFGILDEISMPTDSTRCACCGGPMGTHKKYITDNKARDHVFAPARFISAHSEIVKADMLKSIEQYNSLENSYGMVARFLLGSKLIRESYDIKDTRVLVALSLPIHISGLVQLNGRVDRQDSHSGLSPGKRTVTFMYLLTTIPDTESSIDTVSPEEYRYVAKLNEYIKIQRIEKKIHEYAIDGGIHRETIMPALLKEKLIETPSLMPLYYETKFDLPDATPKNLNLTTFYARNHSIGEYKTILYIIKRLFVRQAAWTYDDLWAATKTPPFGLETNPKLFSESNFAIALDNLVKINNTAMDTDHRVITALFDPNDLHIRIGVHKYKVVHVGEFYMRCQVADDVIIKDAELFGKSITPVSQVRIDIGAWLAESKSANDYETEKKKFIAKFSDDIDEIQMIGNYTPEFYRRLLTDIIVDYDTADDTGVFRKVIDVFGKFGAIIFSNNLNDEIRAVIPKMKNSAKSKTPIGFVDTDALMVYNSDWIKLNKPTQKFTENAAIIGYFDTQVNNQPKFKVRRSVQAIRKSLAEKKSTEISDTRTIERGIVCATKTKPELIEIAKSLKISTDKADAKIKTICQMIQEKLIQKEMHERMTGGRTKYLYMWYETQPELK